MSAAREHTDGDEKGQPPDGSQALDGEVVIRGEAGRVVQKSNFKGGVLEGETTMFDEEGGVAQRVSFRAGVMDGPMVVYAGGRVGVAAAQRAGEPDGQALTHAEE